MKVFPSDGGSVGPAAPTLTPSLHPHFTHLTYPPHPTPHLYPHHMFSSHSLYPHRPHTSHPSPIHYVPMFSMTHTTSNSLGRSGGYSLVTPLPFKPLRAVIPGSSSPKACGHPESLFLWKF